mmetsp:Transcript_34666/g.79401  ORF Transcript_34666/g.79401 Transcript_34666/m.79401 type:complete len:93 (+) Transcript_34666:2182-2460(+)
MSPTGVACLSVASPAVVGRLHAVAGRGRQLAATAVPELPVADFGLAISLNRVGGGPILASVEVPLRESDGQAGRGTAGEDAVELFRRRDWRC